MPLTRHLRTPVPQFLFESPHCHQTFVNYNYICPRALHHSQQSRRRYQCSHGHDLGYTRKARFSTTTFRSLASSREPTLYEVLDVPVTATPAEIKKKFYSLSLKHHPDRNPNDPSSSERFAKISSAYQTLSNSTKRSTYDRDHGIHSYSSQSTHSTANPGQHPMGSHSSASYFGSRPASGLSKRRGVFRGPPPSFYAHGGYGKRRAPNTGGFSSTGSGGSAAGGAGAASGKDDDPTSFIDRNSVPHFNARGHYRTQTAEDARRQERRSRESVDINEQYIGGRGDFAMRFVIVMSILLGAAGLTGFMRWSSATEGYRGEKAGKQKRATDG